VHTEGVRFVGFYTSSTTAQTGCVARFATTERDDLLFPPQAERSCELCQLNHNFRLDRVVSIGTPRQRNNVRASCAEQGYVLDVELAPVS
jgi:hypothetical protein